MSLSLKLPPAFRAFALSPPFAAIKERMFVIRSKIALLQIIEEDKYAIRRRTAQFQVICTHI